MPARTHTHTHTLTSSLLPVKKVVSLCLLLLPLHYGLTLCYRCTQHVCVFSANWAVQLDVCKKLQRHSAMTPLISQVIANLRCSELPRFVQCTLLSGVSVLLLPPKHALFHSCFGQWVLIFLRMPQNNSAFCHGLYDFTQISSFSSSSSWNLLCVGFAIFISISNVHHGSINVK